MFHMFILGYGIIRIKFVKIMIKSKTLRKNNKILRNVPEEKQFVLH